MLLDEAIELASAKPDACIILKRPQQDCDLKAGRDHDYLPPSDPRVLAATPVIESSFLDDVSCVSVTFCLAVGHRTDGTADSDSLVLRWNGTTWTTLTTPTPSGALATLTGVSCATTTACVAVGSATTRRDDRRTMSATISPPRRAIAL